MYPEIFTRCLDPNAAAQIKRCPRVARSPPLHVQVQISGVPDSSNVSYQLSVGETVDAIRSFLTPPKVAAESRITIAVVGDWGQTDNSVKTGQHMLESNSTITLIAGDLSYADGFQPYVSSAFPTVIICNTLVRYWDSWGRMAEGLLSSRPFMAAPGLQHESRSLPSLPRCPASYSACLRKPRNRREHAA
jgi:hypothetical protein